MQFLLDENVDTAIAQFLSRKGHDTLHAIHPPLCGVDDAKIASACEQQNRILITHDKGFGGRIIGGTFRPSAMILLRLTDMTGPEQAVLFRMLWPVVESSLPGNIVAVGKSHIRVRPISLTTT